MTNARQKKKAAKQADVQIGSNTMAELDNVQENDLAHGEFGQWLESIGFNDRMARKFMKVSSELSKERTTSSDLGLEALYQIATLPESERDKTHTTSKGEEKAPDEMTVKELREVKRQLKDEQRQREEAEKKAERAKGVADSAQRRKVFEGSNVRIVEKDGNPWFVAKDVSDILGFKDAWSMTRNLEDDEKLNLSLRGGGQNRNTAVINEPGLYSAVMRSKKPEAKRFKRWVTHEILPTIRKTGGYVDDSQKMVDTYFSGLPNEQKTVLKTMFDYISDLQPKATKYDEFLDSDGMMTITISYHATYCGSCVQITGIRSILATINNCHKIVTKFRIHGISCHGP